MIVVFTLVFNSTRDQVNSNFPLFILFERKTNNHNDDDNVYRKISSEEEEKLKMKRD